MVLDSSLDVNTKIRWSGKTIQPNPKNKVRLFVDKLRYSKERDFHDSIIIKFKDETGSFENKKPLRNYFHKI